MNVIESRKFPELCFKNDASLKNCSEQSNVYRGTSNGIQNDLISAVEMTIIKYEINKTRFIAMFERIFSLFKTSFSKNIGFRLK